MYLKQLNKIEHAIKVKTGDIPGMHVVFMDANTTKQQALEIYKDRNHTEPGDKFLFVQLLPDDFKHKAADFLWKNNKLYKKLINEGFTINEILTKYVG